MTTDETDETGGALEVTLEYQKNKIKETNNLPTDEADENAAAALEGE